MTANILKVLTARFVRILGLRMSLSAIAFLAAILGTGGCKPASSSTSGQPSAPTKIETCLVTINNDTNAAVEQFIETDLTQGKLFSKENPLSHSEAAFAKLSRSTREKSFPQITSELTAIKKLARAVKDRRDQAKN